MVEKKMKYKQKLADGSDIVIEYDDNSEEALKILSYIKTDKTKIKAFLDDRSYLINLNDIYYFEIVDNKIFAYKEKKVFEIRNTIAELINSYKKYDFIRISKQVVVNMTKIKQLKTELNGRIRIILDNDEALIISRHYAYSFRKKLGETK
jgi:DNA-binding LytR/AlgR family response regulator